MQSEIASITARLDVLEGQQLVLDLLASGLLVGQEKEWFHPLLLHVETLAPGIRDSLVKSTASDLKIQAFDDAVQKLRSIR